MKRLVLTTLACGLLATSLTACSSTKDDIVQESEEKKEETVYIPELQLDNNFYRVLLPYKPSEARGVIVNNVYTKYDMKEVEEGLLRISSQYFSPDKYYFQDGQYLNKETIYSWLHRSNKDEAGLNPALEKGKKDEEVPSYLAHIQEQNYLTKNGDKAVALSGISIGLALNSIYYSSEGKEVEIPDSKVKEEGMKIANEIVRRMREELEVPDVPIAIGLFKQQPRNAIVPGTYFLTGLADKGKTEVTGWKGIDEEYVLLPAKDDENERYQELSNLFTKFQREVDQYFPNFVNVIGYGHYQDGGISSINVEIPIQFFGTSELIGFTQHVTTLVMKYFSTMDIEVSVTSVNGPEALILKKEDDEEPFVHIYNY